MALMSVTFCHYFEVNHCCLATVLKKVLRRPRSFVSVVVDSFLTAVSGFFRVTEDT